MGLFNFWKSKEEVTVNNKTKRQARRPTPQNITENYVVNKELTKGLFHNSYPGFTLSAGIVYPFIMIPVAFMGNPLFRTEEEDEILDEYMEKYYQQFDTFFKKLFIQCHRDGTIWVWSKWDNKSRKLIHEFIEDDTVTDIIKDLNTKEIIEIYTDEQITLSIGENQTTTTRRKRHFTKTQITIRYEGGNVPIDQRDKTIRNVTGMLPIHFSNNVDGDEIRGYSDIERILAPLKNYHDLSAAEVTMLAKFAAKLILGVKDVDVWLKDNGFASIDEIDISNLDLIFKRVDNQETVEFEFPNGASKGYQDAKIQIFRQLVVSMGVPELVLGVKTEGNANTAAEQMSTLVQFVQDKQIEKNEGLKKLVTADMRILSVADNAPYTNQSIVPKWNELEAISDETKSIIFKNFGDGLSKIVETGAVTKQIVYNLFMQNFPKATEETFEEFVSQMWEMGRFLQWKKATLMEGDEHSGLISEDDEAVI